MFPSSLESGLFRNLEFPLRQVHHLPLVVGVINMEKNFGVELRPWQDALVSARIFCGTRFAVYCILRLFFEDGFARLLTLVKLLLRVWGQESVTDHNSCRGRFSIGIHVRTENNTNKTLFLSTSTRVPVRKLALRSFQN